MAGPGSKVPLAFASCTKVGDQRWSQSQDFLVVHALKTASVSHTDWQLVRPGMARKVGSGLQGWGCHYQPFPSIGLLSRWCLWPARHRPRDSGIANVSAGVGMRVGKGMARRGGLRLPLGHRRVSIYSALFCAMDYAMHWVRANPSPGDTSHVA